ncbi:MAG: putative Ig domain-containing protein [Thalassolituus sp.]|jgi:hypothetical protein
MDNNKVKDKQNILSGALKAVVPMLAMATPLANASIRPASVSRQGLSNRAAVTEFNKQTTPMSGAAFSAFGKQTQITSSVSGNSSNALSFLRENGLLSAKTELLGSVSGDLTSLNGRKQFLSCTNPAYTTISNCTSGGFVWNPGGADTIPPRFKEDNSGNDYFSDITLAVGASTRILFEITDNKAPLNDITFTVTSNNQSAISNAQLQVVDTTPAERSAISEGNIGHHYLNINNVTGQGGASITVTASDPSGNTSSKTFAVDTGAVPVMANAAIAITVLEDSGSNTVSVSNFAASDSDSGQTLTWSTSGGTKGTPQASGTASTPTSNATPTSVTYTPTANAAGSDTFSVNVSDGIDTDSRTVNVTITPVNDEPTISSLANQTFNGVGGSAQTVAGVASMSSTGGGTDENTQTVDGYVVSEVSDPSGVVSSVSIASNGTLTYTPTANVEGVATIQAQVRDSGGVTNGGDDLSQTETFTITVDTLAPSLSEVTAVTSPTNDSTPDVTINVSQAGTLAVGGSCGSASEGAIAAGNRTITLTQSDNSTPLADGTYSDCTVTVTDANGNASSVLTLSAFQVQSDSTAPVISEITPITTSGFGYINDDTPSYTLNSDEAGTISFSGSCGVATPTTVLSGDTTITFAQLNEGSYSDCALKVTDAAGNESNALNLSTFTVDTTAPSVQTVTAAEVNTASTAASYSFTVTYTDPTYNLISPNQTASVNDVTVQDSSGNPLTVTSAVWEGQSPGSPQFATYTVTPPGGTWDSADDGTYNISVNGGQVTDYAGNFVPATANAGSLSVDVTVPVISEVTAVSTPTNITTPTYLFSTTEAGTIVYSGGCSSSTTAATLGNNSVTFNSLTEGTYSGCTLTLTDALGNTSDVLNVSSFVIDSTAPVISSGTAASIEEATALSFDLTATDGVTSTPTFSLTGTNPAWVTLVNNRLGGTAQSVTLNTDVTVNIQAVDEAGNSTTGTVTLTIIDSELKVITDAAGAINSITATQLNAVDGVSGALAVNESYYQAAIAAGTASDFDTAAEIQAMVTAVNASVTSVPAFTSVNSLNLTEGETLSHALTATDAANDALTFSLKAGSPSWLSVSGSTLSGTVPDPSGDSEVFIATVIVDDGFGNEVEQSISITVLDAEIGVISNAAGSANTINSTQLNAVDGVSGSLAANESYYQAAIAAGSASDFDTAAEIQAMVTAVNASVSSVPAFTSANSFNLIEGDAFSHALTATDAANDTLTFSLKAGSPSWLTVSGSTLSGTVPDPSGDSEVLSATVIVDDGFGNMVEQAISITVQDAELKVITDAAGSTNTISATQLNAVDGVSGSLAANESYYQAAIAAGSASDFDTAAEIQAMVTAVNASVTSVPAFTSINSFDVVEGEVLNHALTATDAASDTLTFSLKAGSPSWLSVSGSTLSGTVPDPSGDSEAFTATVIVDDGFGNTVEQAISITVLDAEVKVITDAAGAANTISATQLNAVDGVSGALAANESYYQAAIAVGSASDFDTAAEIQAMVTSVNESVASVPEFTSIDSLNLLEGEVLNHTLTATDAANDALTFSLKAGSPSWLSVSGSTLSGTVPDPSGDTQIFTATVIVDDGFGNTVEQAISITVLDAEVSVITDAAGSANTINSTQLNAVDGVSGSLAANESYYQAAIAAGSASDFDTAAEIQAMVTAVNASVTSVPAFTSVNSLNLLEGEVLNHALTATDAANDALTFSLKAGSPSWLSVSGSTLSGTVPDPAGDSEVFAATVIVDDGFGNTVEQEISLTVVDAEINVISTAAGADNTITFTQLNAVDGVSGALEANEALYQAVIAAGSASDFDTAAEIQAMVTSVNTVPSFTSVNSVEVVEGETLSHVLTATDAASDALTFSLKAGSPDWLSVSGSTLSGTVPDPTGDTQVFTATVIVDDGFGNTVEQEISITVLDAEVNAITVAAGAANSISFTQLNAVDGVLGALEANEALYQAAIAAGSASDFDTAAEIQAMVNRVNSQASVPVITSSSTLDSVVDQAVSFDLTATDAASDTLAFSVQSGLPTWLTLTTNSAGVQQLTGTPSSGDVGVFTAVIEVTDGFTPVTQTLTINVNALAAITIYGRPVVANSLTTDVTDGNGITSASFTYVWFVDGAPVPGETDSGYLVRESDLGKSIRVDVTFTDDDGLNNSASDTVGPVISIEQNAWNNITDSVGAVSAAPTFDDYRNVGLSDLTDDELTRILSILNRAVNQQVADGDIDELSELEALVDAILEGQDDDLDGLPNMLEDDGLVDTDRDGIDDRDDVDADNDGIRDNLEIDALVDMADDDSDGIVNLFDFDVDGDGYPDFKDYTDANLNGVIDEFETLSGLIAAFAPTPVVSTPVVSAAALAPVAAKTAEVDTDGDGIINSLDIDADGDGVFDLTEAGLPDADENALVDAGTAIITDYADLPDTDVDGIADFLQLKSNGTDTDLSLGGVLAALDLDLDGMIDVTTDVDLDGLADVVDNAIGAFGSAKDFDGDGIPNHLDPDDDNDNRSDVDENAELAQFFTGEDADGDGIDDGFDALINGVANGVDANGNGVRDDRELPDLDGDGLVDYLDDDADGDGIRDDIDDEIALPVQLAPGATLDDLDGDGVLDTVDPSVNTDIDVKTASKGSMSLGILFLLAGALVLMRRRTRLLVAMPLAIVAGHSQAADSQGIDSEAADGEPQSSNFSFVTSVGLTKFDTDLADSLELTDENGAGFVFGLGYQLTDELAAEATYGILGKAGVNTGWVDYSSLALYLQYRPELVSYGKLRGQFKLGMNRVFYDVADGLNIDNKSADVLTFAVGADYEVNGTDAVEFMFTSFAEDVRFYSVGYRHNF